MQLFTNKFSIAVNQDKSEVIINFFQDVPQTPPIDASGSAHQELSSTTQPVANIVMTGQLARNFVLALGNMLDA